MCTDDISRVINNAVSQPLAVAIVAFAFSRQNQRPVFIQTHRQAATFSRHDHAWPLTPDPMLTYTFTDRSHREVYCPLSLSIFPHYRVKPAGDLLVGQHLRLRSYDPRYRATTTRCAAARYHRRHCEQRCEQPGTTTKSCRF